MIYYDFSLQHKQQKKIFMNYKNFDTEKLVHQTQSDLLIKQIKIFEINLNLFCASVMILCESTYDQKLNNQISKRVYRSSQKRIVIYKISCNNTVIEKLIKSMRKNASIFEKKFIFFKNARREWQNVIREDDYWAFCLISETISCYNIWAILFIRYLVQIDGMKFYNHCIRSS